MLLVDDDPRLLTVLSDVLRSEGHAITTAANGEEALHRKLAATLRYMERLQTSVAGRGDRLLTVFTPTSFRAREVFDKTRDDIELLKSIMRQRGWRYVDIQDELRARVSRQDLTELFYAHDFHPTPKGYAFIADRVAEAMAVAKPQL